MRELQQFFVATHQNGRKFAKRIALAVHRLFQMKQQGIQIEVNRLRRNPDRELQNIMGGFRESDEAYANRVNPAIARGVPTYLTDIEDEEDNNEGVTETIANAFIVRMALDVTTPGQAAALAAEIQKGPDTTIIRDGPTAARALRRWARISKTTARMGIITPGAIIETIRRFTEDLGSRISGPNAHALFQECSGMAFNAITPTLHTMEEATHEIMIRLEGIGEVRPFKNNRGKQSTGMTEEEQNATNAAAWVTRVPPEERDCKIWLRGDECETGCRFKHDPEKQGKYKGVDCMQWKNGGTCRFGNVCMYVHSAEHGPKKGDASGDKETSALTTDINYRKDAEALVDVIAGNPERVHITFINDIRTEQEAANTVLVDSASNRIAVPDTSERIIRQSNQTARVTTSKGTCERKYASMKHFDPQGKDILGIVCPGAPPICPVGLIMERGGQVIIHEEGTTICDSIGPLTITSDGGQRDGLPRTSWRALEKGTWRRPQKWASPSLQMETDRHVVIDAASTILIMRPHETPSLGSITTRVGSTEGTFDTKLHYTQCPATGVQTKVMEAEHGVRVFPAHNIIRAGGYIVFRPNDSYIADQTNQRVATIEWIQGISYARLDQLAMGSWDINGGDRRRNGAAFVNITEKTQRDRTISGSRARSPQPHDRQAQGHVPGGISNEGRMISDIDTTEATEDTAKTHAPSGRKECRTWLCGGACEAGCKSRHDPEKWRKHEGAECLRWKSGRTCRYGDKCAYRHGTNSRTTKHEAQRHDKNNGSRARSQQPTITQSYEGQTQHNCAHTHGSTTTEDTIRKAGYEQNLERQKEGVENRWMQMHDNQYEEKLFMTRDQGTEQEAQIDSDDDLCTTRTVGEIIQRITIPERPFDAYACLGCPHKPTDREIAKAYRDEAKHIHPDRSREQADAFHRLTKAKEILLNERKKEDHDKELSKYHEATEAHRILGTMKKTFEINLHRAQLMVLHSGAMFINAADQEMDGTQNDRRHEGARWAKWRRTITQVAAIRIKQALKVERRSSSTDRAREEQERRRTEAINKVLDTAPRSARQRGTHAAQNAISKAAKHNVEHMEQCIHDLENRRRIMDADKKEQREEGASSKVLAKLATRHVIQGKIEEAEQERNKWTKESSSSKDLAVRQHREKVEERRRALNGETVDLRGSRIGLKDTQMIQRKVAAEGAKPLGDRIPMRTLLDQERSRQRAMDSFRSKQLAGNASGTGQRAGYPAQSGSTRACTDAMRGEHDRRGRSRSRGRERRRTPEAHPGTPGHAREIAAARDEGLSRRQSTEETQRTSIGSRSSGAKNALNPRLPQAANEPRARRSRSASQGARIRDAGTTNGRQNKYRRLEDTTPRVTPRATMRRHGSAGSSRDARGAASETGFSPRSSRPTSYDGSPHAAYQAIFAKGKARHKGVQVYGKAPPPGTIKGKGKQNLGSSKGGKGHSRGPDDSNTRGLTAETARGLAEAIAPLLSAAASGEHTAKATIPATVIGKAPSRGHKGRSSKGQDRSASAESRWSQPSAKGSKGKPRGNKGKGKPPRTSGDWKEAARQFGKAREDEKDIRYQKAVEAAETEGVASRQMQEAFGKDADRIVATMADDPDIRDGGKSSREAAMATAPQTSNRITEADKTRMIDLILKGSKCDAAWARLWETTAKTDSVSSHDAETLKEFIEFVTPTFGRAEWFRQAAERITWLQEHDMIMDDPEAGKPKTPDAPSKPDLTRSTMIELIRAGQKNDKAWNQAWGYVCIDENSTTDPTHMSTAEMRKFIDAHRGHREMAWYQQIVMNQDENGTDHDDTDDKAMHACEIAAAAATTIEETQTCEPETETVVDTIEQETEEQVETVEHDDDSEAIPMSTYIALGLLQPGENDEYKEREDNRRRKAREEAVATEPGQQANEGSDAHSSAKEVVEIEATPSDIEERTEETSETQHAAESAAARHINGPSDKGRNTPTDIDDKTEEYNSSIGSSSLPRLLDIYADSPRFRDSVTETYVSTPSDRVVEDGELWASDPEHEEHTGEVPVVQDAHDTEKEGHRTPKAAQSRTPERRSRSRDRGRSGRHDAHTEDHLSEARDSAKARGRNMDMSICDSVAASSMSEREMTPHKKKASGTQKRRGHEQKDAPRDTGTDERVTELMIDRAHKTYVGIKFEVAHADGKRSIVPYKNMPTLAAIAKRAHASVSINEGQVTGQADPRELLKGKLERTETTTPHTAQYVMTSNAMIELRISPRNKEAKRNGGNEVTRLIHATAGALIENQPEQDIYSVERDGTRELIQGARHQQGTGTTTGGFRNPYGNQQPGLSADDADEMTRCDLMIIVDRYTQHLEQDDTIIETISGVRHVTKELLETINSRASISRVLGVSIETARRAASTDSECRHTTYMRLLQTINEVCNAPVDICTEEEDEQWATPDSAWENDSYTDGDVHADPTHHTHGTGARQDGIGTWTVDEFTRSPLGPTTNEDVADITQEHLHGTGIGGFRNPYGNGQGKGYKGREAIEREQNKTPEEKRLEDISWAICKILRHSATDWGIHMDSAGYVLVDDLITPPDFDRPRKRETSEDIQAMRKLAPTAEDIERLVRTARKERFQIKTNNHGERVVRALQGHTIRLVEDSQLATLISYGEVPYCMHRTTTNAWWFIQRGGIETRGRNHIHLIRDGETRTEIPGARATSDIQIKVDVKKAQDDGMEFRRAENGVILTRGLEGRIGLKYIREVTRHVGGFHTEGSVIWAQPSAGEPEEHTRSATGEDETTHKQTRLRIRSKIRIEQYGEKKKLEREQETEPCAREITAKVSHDNDTTQQRTERSSSSWEQRKYQSGELQQWTTKGRNTNRRWATKTRDSSQKWNGYRDQWERPRERPEYCYMLGGDQGTQGSTDSPGDITSAGVAVVRYNEEIEQPQILLISRDGKWGRLT